MACGAMSGVVCFHIFITAPMILFDDRLYWPRLPVHASCALSALVINAVSSNRMTKTNGMALLAQNYTFCARRRLVQESYTVMLPRKSPVAPNHLVSVTCLHSRLWDATNNARRSYQKVFPLNSTLNGLEEPSSSISVPTSHEARAVNASQQQKKRRTRATHPHRASFSSDGGDLDRWGDCCWGCSRDSRAGGSRPELGGPCRSLAKGS
jgi:hypothetical protein